MEKHKYFIWLENTAQERGIDTSEWIAFLQEEAAKHVAQKPINIRLDVIYDLVQRGVIHLPPIT